MITKTMFAGGSWRNNSFRTITRDQLVAASSSLNSLFQFVKNIGFQYSQYTWNQELFEDIQSQDEYMNVPNIDIHFIQSEILKAFDNNSTFYFHVYDEGDCEFISFADEVAAYS